MKNECSSKRILIVDDEPDIRLSLRMLLEFHGYRCEEARNGKDALHLICIQHFDLIITDYQMPHLNGIELVKKLNANLSHESIPVIIISGSLEKFLHDQALELGVQAILVKPYVGEKVLSVVNGTLNDSSCLCSQSS